MRFLLAFIVLIFYNSSAISATFYIDPVNGSMSNDGSEAAPWSTMQEVWEQNKIQTKTYAGVVKNSGAPVVAGDTILLYSGYHGELTISVAYNDSNITVKAVDNNKPTFSKISLSAAKNWVFDGLSISPSYADTFVKGYIVYIEDHNFFGPSSYITVKNCDIFSTTDLHTLGKTSWESYACAGIMTLDATQGAGPNNLTIDGNNIYNVSSGITFMGSDSIISGNTINYFNRYAVRVAVGDRDTIEYNTMMNSVFVDDETPEHDDIIQAWESEEDTCDDLIIRGNIMIARKDTSMPLPTSTVGIGMHDGFYLRMLIENNVIVIDSTSAIIINGAINCTVINNTIVPPTTGGTATVGIYPHKDTRVGYGNVVRNNFFTGVSVATGGGVEDHNLVIDETYTGFVDPSNYDYRLVKSSTAVNAGSPTLPPAIDIRKHDRYYPYDIGAYEYYTNKLTFSGKVFTRNGKPIGTQ